MSEIIEEFEDKEGKKKRIKHIDGLETIILVKPSQWYIDNVLKPIQKQDRMNKVQEEQETKISQKMREIAIREIEKEKNA